MSNLLGLLVLLAMCGTAVADERVGGYTDYPVGANETALLTTALASDAHYAASVKSRVCFAAIKSLQRQVVAGMNYKYTATACEVASAVLGEGKCPAAQLAICSPSEYAIVVFEQPWTSTIQVTSIESTGSQGNTNAGDPYRAG